LSLKSKLKFNGYAFIRADHLDDISHAGSALLIKSSISFKELPSINESYLQATSVIIIINNFPITITSAYLPLGQKITELKLQSFYQKIGNHFIIGGDFNSKHTNWGSRYINTRGRILEKSISKNNISFNSPD
jgi:exonuclease III